MRSFIIVARPESGRGTSEQTAKSVHAILLQHGAPSQLYISSADQQLEAMVKLALQERATTVKPSLCLVICGGDGSIQASVNTLMADAASDVVIGLAPAGTCNDFAFALGVKPTPKEIVNVLLGGLERQVDLGKAGSKYFCTIATLGFESSVNRYLRDHKIHSPSRGWFVATAAAKLTTYPALQVKLTIDGQIKKMSLLSLLAANTSSYGGRIRIAPYADPSDSHFDLVTFHTMSSVSRLLTLPLAVVGRHLSRPRVTCERASHLKIETQRPCEIWADGEPIGETPIELSIVPKALRVLVPHDTDGATRDGQP